MHREGWAGLSYFNIFEFGQNICGVGVDDHPLPPPCNSSGVPSGEAAPSSKQPWANATAYLLSNFPSSVIVAFDCGGSQWCPAPPRDGGRRPIGTWQGGVLMDPADDGYHNHLMAQLERKYDHLHHFEGMVIDRADWNTLYNIDADDGASFVRNRTARSMQYSWLQTLRQLRQTMTRRGAATAVKSSVLLRFCWHACTHTTHDHTTRSHTTYASKNSQKNQNVFIAFSFFFVRQQQPGLRPAQPDGALGRELF